MSTSTQRIARKIAGECVATRARRVGRVVSRLYDDALRPHGLTVAQLSLLVAVSLLGPVRPAELGRRLDLEKSTVSRNLKLLEELRWVRVEVAAEGRGSVVSLTGAGERTLRGAYSSWKSAQQRVQDLIGDEALAALAALAPV